MVQAWFMDDSKEDQRLPHHRNPPKYISLDDLFHKTGVEYFKVSYLTFKKMYISDIVKIFKL